MVRTVGSIGRVFGIEGGPTLRAVGAVHTAMWVDPGHLAEFHVPAALAGAAEEARLVLIAHPQQPLGSAARAHR